ncbi:hypothetical protein [Lysobacter fragariae]
MEQISSGQTFFIKRLFPMLWIGFIGLFLVIGFTTGAWRQNPVFIIQPIAMLAIGLVLFRMLFWNLADEVRDGGAFLIVRKGGVEERVQLANVMNVAMSQFTNPRRITLRLRTPDKLGDEIVFIPKSTFQLNPFARNPVAEALIQRVDRARNHA